MTPWLKMLVEKDILFIFHLMSFILFYIQDLPIRLLGRPHNNKVSMSENYAFEGIGDDDL